jgi:PiT family inorganic phosphate transporter
MIDIVLPAALLVCVYIGWNIGSNDAANAIGPAVGGRVISFRRAACLVAIFAFLGAALEGWKVMETVGEDIVVSSSPSSLSNPLSIFPWATIAAFASAGLWVSIAVNSKIPVSTSQSVVGAVIGLGILISYVYPVEGGARIQIGRVALIALSWILVPLASAFFALVLYRVFRPLLERARDIILINRILAALTVCTGAYLAYALGANNVGVATGLVYAVHVAKDGFLSAQTLGLLGGIALAIGVLTYSKKMMYTVGTEITSLDPISAFVCQFSAALVVHLFTQFGIPVSTTQAIIGAIVGAGIVKGLSTIKRKKLYEIFAGWILTPIISCLIAFTFGSLLLRA